MTNQRLQQKTPDSHTLETREKKHLVEHKLEPGVLITDGEGLQKMLNMT